MQFNYISLKYYQIKIIILIILHYYNEHYSSKQKKCWVWSRRLGSLSQRVCGGQ